MMVIVVEVNNNKNTKRLMKFENSSGNSSDNKMVSKWV